MSKTPIDLRLEKLMKRLEADLPRPAVAATKAERAARRDAYKFGTVLTDARVEHPCIVLNINGAGAKVALTGADALPPRVKLSVPSAGLHCDADVVWQDGAEAGLKFSKPR